MAGSKRLTALQIGLARQGFYSAGNFGKNILWGTTEVTLLFVMIDLMGIKPADAGGVHIASLLFAAALDPIIGALADRTRTRWGRYGPFILLGAPACSFTIAGLYALPLQGTSSALTAGAWLMAFRLAYALIDLPHNAMLSAVDSTSRGRARIAVMRFGFSSLGSIMVAGGLSFVTGPLGLSESRLLLYVGAVGCMSALVMIASWAAVRDADRRVAQSQISGPALRNAIGALVRSRSYVVAVSVGAVACLFLPLFAKSLLFLSSYVTGAPERAAVMYAAMVTGQIVGLPLWVSLAQKLEKSRVLQAAHGISLGGVSLLLVNHHAEMASYAACAIVGIGAGGVYSLIWSMIADCTEEISAVHRVRADGLVFGLAIMTQKAATGVGAGCFGWGLAAAGFQSGAAASFAAKSAILGLGLGAPMIGAICCISMLFAYRLTHEKHAKLSKFREREGAF